MPMSENKKELIHQHKALIPHVDQFLNIKRYKSGIKLCVPDNPVNVVRDEAMILTQIEFPFRVYRYDG